VAALLRQLSTGKSREDRCAVEIVLWNDRRVILDPLEVFERVVDTKKYTMVIGFLLQDDDKVIPDDDEGVICLNCSLMRIVRRAIWPLSSK
jgi:hypothetical protein